MLKPTDYASDPTQNCCACGRRFTNYIGGRAPINTCANKNLMGGQQGEEFFSEKGFAMLGEQAFNVPETVPDSESNVLVGGLGLLALVTSFLVYKKYKPGKKDVEEPLLDDDYKLVKNTEAADTQTKA